jgi:hypothetical protein
MIYNFYFWRFQTSVQKFRVSNGQTALHRNELRVWRSGAELPRRVLIMHRGPRPGVRARHLRR